VRDRLAQIYESLGPRDLIEIAILAAVIYLALRLLRKSRGPGMVRGLGLVIIGLFLLAQVAIALFDLTVLDKVLDYFHTTVLVGLLVIFQPELRRGLVMLGRYQLMRYLGHERHDPVADKLADASQAMSRDRVGALIAIEREVTLAPYVETGERLDGEISAALLRTLFTPNSPLHDGAVILCNGRVSAAACQLPLAQPPDLGPTHIGMRHRAAVGLSEETDAVLVVVSEETGRISVAVGGRLEAVPRENLSRRLVELLSRPADTRPSARAA
jgi:diadenylate cyclase